MRSFGFRFSLSYFKTVLAFVYVAEFFSSLILLSICLLVTTMHINSYLFHLV